MNIYEQNIKAVQMDGKEVDFASFDKKVLLIVNTASKCGFTPQFEGLEKLNKQFKDEDLVILGFPCNQFKSQDPGNNEEIESFCKINYGVTFPMFQKLDVNGENRHELYKYLIANTPEKKDKDIKWNFEKFLINKDGEIVKRYSSMKKPKSIGKDIKTLL